MTEIASNSARFPGDASLESGRLAPVAGGDAVALRRAGDGMACLQRKADLLQAIVDSLSDGLAAVDLDGRFLQFNPSGAAILGQGATDAPSEQWSTQYGLYLPDQQTPFPHDELPLIRALRGHPSRDVEMYLRTQVEAEGRWLKVTGAPVRDDQGEITGGVVLFRDDTATKQAQLALEAERRFLRHLITWQDRERQLTAYDLHDGVVQLITGALLHLEGLRGRQAERIGSSATELGGVVDLLREALDEARRLIGGLRPLVLDEHGMVGAVEFLVAQSRESDNLEVSFTHNVGRERLPPIVEVTVFRIVQEALQNVARHAEAQRATVELEMTDDVLRLTIFDGGRGFNMDDRKHRRFGLRGIQERCRLLGGTVSIESAPGSGTTIEARLPTHPTPLDLDESRS